MKNTKKDFRYLMSDTIKPLLVVVLAVFMAGCALAPGPHYSNSPGWFSEDDGEDAEPLSCLLYTSPSPRDRG